jgi:hypothetical protein
MSLGGGKAELSAWPKQAFISAAAATIRNTSRRSSDCSSEHVMVSIRARKLFVGRARMFAF